MRRRWPARRGGADGITIPWPLLAVLMPILAGVIWINVQLARISERVDILYGLEAERHPQQGPRLPRGEHRTHRAHPKDGGAGGDSE